MPLKQRILNLFGKRFIKKNPDQAYVDYTYFVEKVYKLNKDAFKRMEDRILAYVTLSASDDSKVKSAKQLIISDIIEIRQTVMMEVTIATDNLYKKITNKDDQPDSKKIPGPGGDKPVAESDSAK